MKKYSYIQIKQDECKPYQINIVAEVEENGYFYNDIIGRFCFYDGEGSITLEDDTRKKYKRFSAMLNLIYTIDPVASMDAGLIDQVKEEANKVKITQQTEDNEQQEDQTKENKNNITQQETETIYTAFNRSFPTYEQAYQYCLECDFDPSMIHVEPITALPVNLQYFTEQRTEQPQTETDLFQKSEMIRDYIDANGWKWNDYKTLSNITGETEETCRKIFGIYFIIPPLRELLKNEAHKKGKTLYDMIDKLKYFAQLSEEEQSKLVKQYSPKH